MTNIADPQFKPRDVVLIDLEAAQRWPDRQPIAFITLECDRGDHQNCPGKGKGFGKETLRCQCIHHREGVVLPEGFPGRT